MDLIKSIKTMFKPRTKPKQYKKELEELDRIINKIKNLELCTKSPQPKQQSTL